MLLYLFLIFCCPPTPCRFPQKLPRRTNQVPSADEKELQNNIASWPSDVASSDLWNENIREELRKNKIVEAELNVRRSKVLSDNILILFS